ncbi:MAG: hypothetical protein GY811_23015 [Myxococcales bacterium]|nr:hypothetical protein [Myxococcales bacterium]
MQCKFLRKTMHGGVLSLAGSALAGAATGWVFGGEFNGRGGERPVVQLLPGGGITGMAFDF